MHRLAVTIGSVLILVACNAASPQESDVRAAKETTPTDEGSETVSGSPSEKSSGSGTGQAKGSAGSTGAAGGSGAPLPNVTVIVAILELPGATNRKDGTFRLQGDKLFTYRFKVGFADDTDCMSETGYSAEILATEPLDPKTAAFEDGSVVLCVIGRAKDAAVPPLANAQSFYFTIDTKAPSLELATPQNELSSATSIALLVTEIATITAKITATDTCSSDEAYEPASLNDDGTIVIDAGDLEDGPHTLCVRAKDSAGNLATKSAQWVIDHSAPTATITGTPTADSPETTVRLTISGADAISYRWKLATQDTCSESQGYSASLPLGELDVALAAHPDGPVFVCVLAMDASENLQDVADATKAQWTKIPAMSALEATVRVADDCGEGQITLEFQAYVGGEAVAGASGSVLCPAQAATFQIPGICRNAKASCIKVTVTQGATTQDSFGAHPDGGGYPCLFLSNGAQGAKILDFDANGPGLLGSCASDQDEKIELKCPGSTSLALDGCKDLP